ncbi:TRAP transporter small permease [Lampropedia puyangensis]|uniref:TRAP transporter small permease protein n=1 Tax=Lampropedia puyangensis TaxID=1330072 RepID=A0A4S8FBH2_9BURK|nr:TRAP transporter small permease [Lampropedia puyangensis]
MEIIQISTEPKTKVPLAIEDCLSVGLLALLSLITLANVLTRYFTNTSFAWTEEISIFLMMVLALVAGSAAAARNNHIQIDYLCSRVGPGPRRFLAVFSALAVVAMFVLMVWLGGQLAWDEFRFEETSPGLGLPKWIYTVWLPILSLAIALRAFGVAWRAWRAPTDSTNNSKEAV